MADRRYRGFRREVCAFRRRDLLPAVAREGARLARLGPEGLAAALGVDNVVTPWALAAIARESILSGTDAVRRQTVLGRHIRRLCRCYAELDDPMTLEGDRADPTGYFVRTAFEQFPSQMSPFEEVSRTSALYLDAARSVTSAPLFSQDAWIQSLGIPLETFLGVGFFLSVWAMQHEGWVDLDWLGLPQFDPILRALDEAAIRESVRRHLATDVERFRQRDSTANFPPGLLEHRFNPLEARPLLRLDGRLLAPSPSLLLTRISATGMYYDRCSEPRFTDQLGAVFQEYIGRNLKLIPAATVMAEIEYARSKSTVDWIVVFDEVVVLVEVKASRLTERARAGIPDALESDISRTLLRAHEQIETTAGLIRSRHSALSRIPYDRPLLGLTVTLEPFWLLGTALTPIPQPAGATVPVVVASAREVEHSVAWATSNDLGFFLRTVLEERRTGTRVLASLSNDKNLMNPLLEAGWDRMHSWLELASAKKQA